VGRTARRGMAGRALTIVGPEDETAWRKLRRQGAPQLGELDLADVLEGVDWQSAASPAAEKATASGKVRRIHPDFGRTERAAETLLSNRPKRRKSGSRGGVRAVMPKGTVKKVVSDRGFGFIAADDGKEYFFHQSGMDSSLNFDNLRGGEAVSFDIEQSQKGPRANHVRAA
jgi:cold shock protein